MHDDQLHVDLDVVRRLLADQYPHWVDEPVREVAGSGTVNAIYRIGAGLAARFPLRAADPGAVAEQLRAEAAACLELSTCCPFATPLPITVGHPGHGYPLPWLVQTWLPGEIATPDSQAASVTSALDLATLIRAFRAADTRGRHFTGAGRGGDLRDHDRWMDRCFRESAGLLDVDRLRALWARLRELPPAGHDVMCHGDLIPANLLVQGEHLIGVLDGGGFAGADPALDLVAAWHLLDIEAREALRAALGSGSTEWRRGAAWAFAQAMGLTWYYRTTNPAMSALGVSTLARLVDDGDL
ncbi:MAG: aminoglycoside phosphotransferase family protein [Candidatus Dormiibacterota bacterium]